MYDYPGMVKSIISAVNTLNAQLADLPCFSCRHWLSLFWRCLGSILYDRKPPESVKKEYFLSEHDSIIRMRSEYHIVYLNEWYIYFGMYLIIDIVPYYSPLCFNNKWHKFIVTKIMPKNSFELSLNLTRTSGCKNFNFNLRSLPFLQRF